MKNIITKAGIRITHKCNMNCLYCNVKHFNTKELTFAEWDKAFVILKNLGIKDVVLLGGEPTEHKDIVKVVDLLVNKYKIKCSLTTNAFNNFNIIKELLDIGLSQLGVSVDSIDLNYSISPLKSKYGLDMVKNLIDEQKCINLVNYIVLSKKNASKVIETIKYFSNLGISSYILPYHWGNQGEFEHRKDLDMFAFITKSDQELFNTTIERIKDLKTNKYLIKNSFQYLDMIKQHILKLDWHCNGLSELRIDSDGKLACCCDKIGNIGLSIFDLPDKLNEFFERRENIAKECKGCMWPSSFEAEKLREDLY